MSLVIHFANLRRLEGMIHYSCDRCRRVLDANQDQRYVVRIEVQAVLEPPTVSDPDDDRDHLLEVEELLAEIELSEENLDDDLFQQLRYDLCRECYLKYRQNPLGFESVSNWGVNDN